MKINATFFQNINFRQNLGMFRNGVVPMSAKMRFRSKEGIAFLPAIFSPTFVRNTNNISDKNTEQQAINLLAINT
jgi:hypothetical protein